MSILRIKENVGEAEACRLRHVVKREFEQSSKSGQVVVLPDGVELVSPYSALPIGTQVVIGDEVPAIITSVCFRSNGISYELTWWDGRTRKAEWFALDQFRVGEPEKMGFGFGQEQERENQLPESSLRTPMPPVNSPSSCSPNRDENPRKSREDPSKTTKFAIA